MTWATMPASPNNVHSVHLVGHSLFALGIPNPSPAAIWVSKPCRPPHPLLLMLLLLQDALPVVLPAGDRLGAALRLRCRLARCRLRLCLRRLRGLLCRLCLLALVILSLQPLHLSCGWLRNNEQQYRKQKVVVVVVENAVQSKG